MRSAVFVFAALCALTLSPTLRAQETRAAHEQEAAGHVHTDDCDHEQDAGHGRVSPWAKGAVTRSVRADSLALLLGFGGVGLYAMIGRRRGGGAE